MDTITNRESNSKLKEEWLHKISVSRIPVRKIVSINKWRNKLVERCFFIISFFNLLFWLVVIFFLCFVINVMIQTVSEHKYLLEGEKKVVEPISIHFVCVHVYLCVVKFKCQELDIFVRSHRNENGKTFISVTSWCSKAKWQQFGIILNHRIIIDVTRPYSS